MASTSALDAVFAKWDCGPLGSQSASLNSSALATQYNKLMDVGRKSWQNHYQKTNHQPPSYRQSRQRNRKSRTNHHKNDSMEHLGLCFGLKSTPLIDMPFELKRPFVADQCLCLPRGRFSEVYDKLSSMGYDNVLDMDSDFKSVYKRSIRFKTWKWVRQRNVRSKYPDLSMEVLISQRLKEAIHSTTLQHLGICDAAEGDSKETEKVKTQLEVRSRKIIKRMQSSISGTIVRFTGWVLHHLLGQLFDKIIINKGQIEMVREAGREGKPLIFVPLHRSHMDYILVTFILFNYDLKIPHVAAGDNLLIPFFGWLLRGLGAFYIRRKLDGNNEQKDHVYRAILQTYVESLLSKGENIEFFIEGGRSRSGKPLYPKAGLMSVVVDAFSNEKVDDVYIVPVSFSYEKILEGAYANEQMGGPKVVESFFNALKAIYRVFQHRFGNVRVDFGEPFSLKGYMKVSQTYSAMRGVPKYCGLVNGKDKITHLGSNSSLLTIDDYKLQVQLLGEHTIYCCTRIQAVMSTHIIAFLLLSKYRSGIDLPTLEQTLDDMKFIVPEHKRIIGFCGKSRDVVLYACRLLQSAVDLQTPNNTDISELNEQEICGIQIKPKLTVPSLLELNYSANVLTPTFALEAVIATSMCIEIGEYLWLDSGPPKDIVLNKNAVLQKALSICQILQYEFIFKPPCIRWDHALSSAFRSAIVGFLSEQHEEDGNTRQHKWVENLSRSLDFDDSDDDFEEDNSNWDVEDQEYILKHESRQTWQSLKYMTNIVAPYLEAYHVVMCNIGLIEHDTTWSEETFIKRMLSILQNRFESGITQFGENVSLDLVKNCIRSLEQIEVLDIWKDGHRRMLLLSDSNEANIKRQAILDILESCRIVDMI